MRTNADGRRWTGLARGRSAKGGSPSTGVEWASVWTPTTGVLTLCASLAGLLADGMYGNEPPSTIAMLRGYDFVTAMVVVPLLAVAWWLGHRGSVRGRLATICLLAYLLYTYAYYLFGTGFGALLLVHAAIVAVGLVALIAEAIGLDVEAFGPRVRGTARTRGAAVVLAVLAVALGGMWVYFAVHNAVSGVVPAGSQLVETDAIVHLGMVLDLAFLVPLYAAAAILLWRRSVWGYVLGVVSVIAGLFHQLSYMVAMPFQVAAGIPGAVFYDSGEPIIVLVYLLGAFFLLRPERSSPTSS